jgi:DNA-binding transcriptional LysR family regulator
MIARHRTLSAAARAMGVRQPTMGRRLQALEHRAGATLLQKTPDGYVLTAAGEAVLAAVERIEAETQAVERLIAGKDLRLEGTVRLTTVETLAADVLSPVLAAFRVDHPLVRVEIVAATRSLSLTKREADVALRIAPFLQPDLVARKVGELAYGLYASPAYLERHGTPDWGGGAGGDGAGVSGALSGRRRPETCSLAGSRWGGTGSGHMAGFPCRSASHAAHSDVRRCAAGRFTASGWAAPADRVARLQDGHTGRDGQTGQERTCGRTNHHHLEQLPHRRRFGQPACRFDQSGRFLRRPVAR